MNDAVMIIRMEAVFSGAVQGVGFRAAAKQLAEDRGVCGYVHNSADGRVDAVFEGPRHVVRAVIGDLCGRFACDAAVSAESKATHDFSDFEIRRF